MAARYPVFHDELSHARGDMSDWTLATVLFDLNQARAMGISSRTQRLSNSNGECKSDFDQMGIVWNL